MLKRRNLLKLAAASYLMGTTSLLASTSVNTEIFIPASVDWCSQVNGNWQVFLNDDLGCCVEAAMANAVLQWTTINKHRIIASDEEVLTFYETAAGYDVDDPASDQITQGTCTATALAIWRETGWKLHHNKNFLIDYAELQVKDNREKIKKAIYLFGGIMVDLALPDEYFSHNEEMWTMDRKIKSKTITNHCVYVCAYDSEYLTFVSHAHAALMSWELFEKRSFSAYVMLNPLWLKHGIAPNGYKYGRLRDEIIKLDVEYTPKGK